MKDQRYHAAASMVGGGGGTGRWGFQQRFGSLLAPAGRCKIYITKSKISKLSHKVLALTSIRDKSISTSALSDVLERKEVSWNCLSWSYMIYM